MTSPHTFKDALNFEIARLNDIQVDLTPRPFGINFGSRSYAFKKRIQKTTPLLRVLHFFYIKK